MAARELWRTVQTKGFQKSPFLPWAVILSCARRASLTDRPDRETALHETERVSTFPERLQTPAAAAATTNITKAKTTIARAHVLAAKLQLKRTSRAFSTAKFRVGGVQDQATQSQQTTRRTRNHHLPLSCPVPYRTAHPPCIAILLSPAGPPASHTIRKPPENIHPSTRTLPPPNPKTTNIHVPLYMQLTKQGSLQSLSEDPLFLFPCTLIPFLGLPTTYSTLHPATSSRPTAPIHTIAPSCNHGAPCQPTTLYLDVEHSIRNLEHRYWLYLRLLCPGLALRTQRLSSVT